MKTIVTAIACILTIFLTGCFDKTAPTTGAVSTSSGSGIEVHQPKAEDYIVKIERLDAEGNSEEDACRTILGNASRAAVKRAWGSMITVKGGGECSCTKKGDGFSCARDVYLGALTTNADGIPRNDDGTPIKGIVP